MPTSTYLGVAERGNDTVVDAWKAPGSSLVFVARKRETVMRAGPGTADESGIRTKASV